VDLDLLLSMAEEQPSKVKVFPDGRVSVNLKRTEMKDGPLQEAREFLESISAGRGD
jgi:hypothetical protein